MRDRTQLIEWLRSELVGPSRPLAATTTIQFSDRRWSDDVPRRTGPASWIPESGASPQEVLYFDRESPHRKYGIGLLHPDVRQAPRNDPAQVALDGTDTVGTDSAVEEQSDATQEAEPDTDGALLEPGGGAVDDDFEVSGADLRRPSILGISFRVRLPATGALVVSLPDTRSFAWQDPSDAPFAVNGLYEECEREWADELGKKRVAPVWRRRSALGPKGITLRIPGSDLRHGTPFRENLAIPGSPKMKLRLEAFPRLSKDAPDTWLITVVVRNCTPNESSTRESTLYQTHFDVQVEDGAFEPYPESQRPFESLDNDEQSLALLYRDSATWAIGHGCGAGWDTLDGGIPRRLFADVLPAAETASMTPDIQDADGGALKYPMRALADLSADGSGEGWERINKLVVEYRRWIATRTSAAQALPTRLQKVAMRHLEACAGCLGRIERGVQLLRQDAKVRAAFRLANLAMLLQQIATKTLTSRALTWDSEREIVVPNGTLQTPWGVFESGSEGDDVGRWRAFQIAFLLLSIEGLASPRSDDREVVDLIWFPTGGGKTEAYLGVVAFYLFHLRLSGAPTDLPSDGTNVLMRYTLRMLTTQQFQRAASLIAAMEFLRRHPELHRLGDLPGQRFSLGLWIGGEASPNDVESAKIAIREYSKDKRAGNPLVLTECPWCRSAIGRYDGAKPKTKGKLTDVEWNIRRVRGFVVSQATLTCSDINCEFGGEGQTGLLPVEVIDTRIYDNRPSLIIATADKLAMIAFKPEAGELFGRSEVQGTRKLVRLPPGLIVQDELHLISGPLGTMYALYEGIFERLCIVQREGRTLLPKLIASTATIRGADEQVRSLYARERTQLFPSPGLEMSDSFFGRYARNPDGSLQSGRLYLGVHATDYGSVLTTQVRAFSSALFRAFAFPEDQRDPWWTLLVFFNSIRELSGAKTLFESDIRSRLKYLFNREGYAPTARRPLRITEELTSRLSQPEIVDMMRRLSAEYKPNASEASIDACLASNIIEVGVDIDRLSLMGVVGQPKTTAQYIQVTGRVGRRWWKRPGLVLTIYNPSKSRDRSHYEQFHSYHRRLYERVEPTSATPFALAAIRRALPGALIAWARQSCSASVGNVGAYEPHLYAAYQTLRGRCKAVLAGTPDVDVERSLADLEQTYDELLRKWSANPAEWQQYPPDPDGEYLMLWPGQYATQTQKQKGVVVASSMRQVDGTGELAITQGYSTSPDQIS